MTCKIEGCGKPVRCKQLCRAHYLRLHRYGSPIAGGPTRGEAKQFILDHVNYDGKDCLTWPFFRTPTGYGDVNFPNIEGQAHRVMCILSHGPPPEPGYEAAHSCGKGHEGCVNRNHLIWKSRIDNIHDKAKHGTQLWGNGVHFAKLTREQALRAKYGNEPGVSLALEFNVKPQTIYNIRNGKTWKGI